MTDAPSKDRREVSESLTREVCTSSRPRNSGRAPTPQADARTRTGDPFITSEVLYQLSYVGESALDGIGDRRRAGAAAIHATAPGRVSGRQPTADSLSAGVTVVTGIPKAATLRGRSSRSQRERCVGSVERMISS
jgi:hypothetical protein